MHEVEVDIIGLEILQRSSDTLLDTLVPRVVQLGGEPDLTAGNTRVDDTLSDFGFVAIGQRCVDMSVSILQSNLDCLTDLIRLGLPGSKTYARHLIARVEREDGLGTLA